MAYNFSLIIPHKNVAHLLPRALDSIPERDDLEVIIVDDNSDPDKVDFDKFPGKDRPNTKIIFTKEGKGAGYARNVGLDQARGQWVFFLDADDLFLPEINDILDICLADKDSDMIYYETMSYNVDKDVEERNPYINLSSCDVDELRYRVLMISSKIIRKSVIDRYHIRSEEIKYSNDTFFSIKCAYYCKKLRIIPRVAYRYLVHEGSLWQTNTVESISCRVKSAVKYYNFGKKHNVAGPQNAAINYYWYALRRMYKISKYEYFKLIIKYSWRLDLFYEILNDYIKLAENKCISPLLP